MCIKERNMREGERRGEGKESLRLHRRERAFFTPRSAMGPHEKGSGPMN